MLSQQRNKNLPGKPTIAPAETSPSQPINISLSEEQAKSIDDFFDYFPCNNVGSQSLDQRLDYYFMDILNAGNEIKGSDYLFFMMLKKLLPSLESIRKQLNP